MTEQSEDASATSDKHSDTPQGDADEHRFGDQSEQSERQVIAEDQTAEQLGNFA
ncbi:hypothetical protein [Sphingomonas sp.]|uniref:hypothetical protein n=1 Tax=Sphingomonas sp. TaxID=28214 RepID=UPI003B3A6BB4